MCGEEQYLARLTVDARPMAHPHNIDHQTVVLDSIHDTIDAIGHAPPAFGTKWRLRPRVTASHLVPGTICGLPRTDVGLDGSARTC